MGATTQGHIVTLEITSGQTYRGKLIEGAPSAPTFWVQMERQLTQTSGGKQPRTT